MADRLRFNVGDMVLCSMGADWVPQKRKEAGSSSTAGGWERGWERAVVVRLRPEESRGVYYQCRLLEDDNQLIYVPNDDDSVISKEGMPPRARLLLAIEQCCPVEHLDFIVKKSSIDLKVISDSVISKAVSSNNPEAFFWLIEDCQLNSNGVRGNKEGNVLHMASEESAVHFFEMVADKVEDKSYNNRENFDVRSLLKQKNSQQQTVLHIAAARARQCPDLMDVLLDPHSLGQVLQESAKDFGGVCLDDPNADILASIVSWKDSKGRTAKDICTMLKAERGLELLYEFELMVAILDRFGAFSSMLVRNKSPAQVVMDFETHFGQPDPAVLEPLRDKLAVAVAGKCREGRYEEVRFLVEKLGAELNPDKMGMWLLKREVEPRVPGQKAYRNWVFADYDVRLFERWDGVDLEGFLRREIAEAEDFLRAEGKEESTWVYSDPSYYLFKFKLRLLFTGSQDLEAPEQEFLPGKLQILEWLTVEHFKIWGSDFVHYHQPEMLEWMCKHKHIQLDSPPDEGSCQHAASLAWLRLSPLQPEHSQAEPAHGRGGDDRPLAWADSWELLSMLCAGYGVLKGLAFLLAERPGRAKEVTHEGLTLLHVAARQGRTEVVAYLVKNKLVSVEAFVGGLNAAHMAFRYGHKEIGEFLLESGCAEVDEEGRDMAWHAEASGEVHMLDLAKKMRVESAEEQCFRKLVELIQGNQTFDTISQYITDCGVELTDGDFKRRIAELGNPFLWFVSTQGMQAATFYRTWLVETLELCEGDYRRALGYAGRNLPRNEYHDRHGCDYVTGIMLQAANTAQHRDTFQYLERAVEQNSKRKALDRRVLDLRCMLENGADMAVIQAEIGAIVAFGMPEHPVFQDSYACHISPSGAPVRRKDIFLHGLSLFPYACSQGFAHIAMWVLDGEAATSDDVLRGLGHAARSGHLETVQLLIEWGGFAMGQSRVNAVGNALCNASEQGHLRVVELLFSEFIRLGGNPNVGPLRKTDESDDSSSDSEGASVSDKHDDPAAAPTRNALTRSLVFYCCGQWNKTATNPALDSEGRANLEDDTEGIVRMAVFRFLLSRKNDIDPNAIGNLERMDWVVEFGAPEKEANSVWCFTRLMHAITLLVSAGADPHVLFNNLASVHVSHIIVPRTFAQDYNINIQDVDKDMVWTRVSGWPATHVAELHRLQEEQREQWAWIDMITRETTSMEQLRQAAPAGVRGVAAVKDRRGWPALHVAASCNRVDVVEWLVRELAVDVAELNRDGQTAEEVARMAGSSSVHECLRKMRAEGRVARFAQGRWRMRQAQLRLQRAVRAVLWVQARCRGWRVRKIYRVRIEKLVRQRAGFKQMWGGVVALLKELPTPECVSWEALKERTFDFTRQFELEDAEDAEEEEEENQTVLQAMAGVVLEAGSGADERTGGEDHDQNPLHNPPLPPVGEGGLGQDAGPPARQGAEVGKWGGDSEGRVRLETAQSLEKILLTEDARKWYKNADSRQSELFFRRLTQLATGERSRILRKLLVGSKNFAIFETYLDQAHTAQRILWTEVRERGGLRKILVWYVSKHKHVTKYMQQIDQADSRLNRQFLSANSVLETGTSAEDEDEDVMVLDEDTVLLDPMFNTPLKIHEADITDLANKDILDSLPLRLTSAEKDIVGKTGTTLVLGRSGTGKTICIAKKMAVDRAYMSADMGRQLFVCRNKKVCDVVKSIQAVEDGREPPHFTQLDPLVEAMLERVAGNARHRFTWVRKVTFRRFSTELGARLQGSSKLNPLVLWTQIQSFIKGSMEAVVARRPLEEEQYLELGTDRVRLEPEQRRAAYAAYQQYSRWCEDQRAWDDGDRMLCLLGKMWGDGREEGQWAEYYKVYVDEVQDLTQAHIAFLFKLSATGFLFLAGDPAQSVEEGVEFRFIEVRQVAYMLGLKPPEKPEELRLNFRAHSGILEVAKAVLDKLYALFPARGSGGKLPDERGLCRGPRPGLLQLSEQELAAVLQKRQDMVVITPEERREGLRGLIGENTLPVVLGIREAKGLEFGEVAVVDFFCGLPRETQQMWKKMLQADHCCPQLALVDWFRIRCPELETILKKLYTAITRAQHRLYIIETKQSVAGTAFFRHLQNMHIAEKQQVLESVSLLTVDEWVSRGLDMALIATSEDADASEDAVIDKEIYWMQKANKYFENARSADMQERAKAQLQSAMARKAMRAAGADWEAAAREAAEAVVECMHCGLWCEAARLAERLLLHLPAQAQQLLDEELLRPLKLRIAPG